MGLVDEVDEGGESAEVEAGEAEEDGAAACGGDVVGKPIKGCCLGRKAELISPIPTKKSSSYMCQTQ